MSAQLKIRDFELVVALHEEGTFTQAAKRIGVTQTALSKRLQDIERKVQARLFDRTHHGVVLTEPGRSFVSGAAEIIHAFQRTIHDAQEAKHGECRRLRIGVSAYLSPKLIETIHAIELPLYRHLAVEIVSGFSSELIFDLQNKTIDLAFVTSPAPNSALTTLCIAKQHFMIMFRKSHPLAAKRSVTLGEIVGYPWVFFKRAIHPFLYDLILHRVEADHKQADIVHYSTHVTQSSAMLNNDSLIGWINPAGVEIAVNQGFVCVPLTDDHIRLETHLASRTDNRSQLVSEFARKFVMWWEEQSMPEQLWLPLGLTRISHPTTGRDSAHLCGD
jgi:DNA-binding transcriptional LysR family regulator